METSKGHICNLGDYEYFIAEGMLYRALLFNPLSIYGYRQGPRQQCRQEDADQYIAMVRKSFEAAA